VQRIDKRVTERFYDDEAQKLLVRHDVTKQDRVVILDRLTQHVKDCCARAGGGKVLDLGCGPGKYFPPLAEDGACLLGVDFSQGMLRKALQLGAKGAATSVARGDIEMLPLPDGTMDMVLSISVLGEYVPVAAGVPEAARVLRSGGLFTFTFMHLLNPYRLYKMLRITALRHVFGRDLNGYDRAGGRMVARFPITPGHVRAIVERSGFRDITLENLNDPRRHCLVTCVKR